MELFSTELNHELLKHLDHDTIMLLNNVSHTTSTLLSERNRLPMHLIITVRKVRSSKVPHVSGTLVCGAAAPLLSDITHSCDDYDRTERQCKHYGDSHDDVTDATVTVVALPQTHRMNQLFCNRGMVPVNVTLYGMHPVCTRIGDIALVDSAVFEGVPQHRNIGAQVLCVSPTVKRMVYEPSVTIDLRYIKAVFDHERKGGNVTRYTGYKRITEAVNNNALYSHKFSELPALFVMDNSDGIIPERDQELIVARSSDTVYSVFSAEDDDDDMVQYVDATELLNAINQLGDEIIANDFDYHVVTPITTSSGAMLVHL